MLEMLKNWKGTVEINGTQYSTINDVIGFKPTAENIHIVLRPAVKKRGIVNDTKDVTQYRITVRQYMTRKSSPEFDFMAKWNKDVPMPFRTMIGEKVKETRGMVYMKLHADMLQEKETVCMCCGRKLTNPVSQYFGVGPECGGHNYVNPFNTDTELKEAVNAYRQKLQNITWEGWVIKSAITEEVEVDG